MFTLDITDYVSQGYLPIRPFWHNFVLICLLKHKTWKITQFNRPSIRLYRCLPNHFTLIIAALCHGSIFILIQRNSMGPPNSVFRSNGGLIILDSGQSWGYENCWTLLYQKIKHNWIPHDVTFTFWKYNWALLCLTAVIVSSASCDSH